MGLSRRRRAAYRQLQLLRIADFVNVGQRFRKTVRIHATGPAGNESAVKVVLERRGKRYSLDDAHEVRRKRRCPLHGVVRGMWGGHAVASCLLQRNTTVLYLCQGRAE